MSNTTFHQKAEATAVAEIVKESNQPHTLNVEHNGLKTQLVLVPHGLTHYDAKKLLESHQKAPERRAGTANFQDLASFIEHANLFKDEHSTLWFCSDEHRASLTSVLDYHQGGSDGAPRFGQHRGHYQFPFSDEWNAWTASNAKAVDQKKFAEFIEDRLLDVADPSAATASAKAMADAIGATFASPSKLLELSRGLSIRVGAKLRNATNLSTGEAQLTYETEHRDENGAPLKIPSAFLIKLQVFKGGAFYMLPARLRYRHERGDISWFYELHGKDRFLKDAFEEACRTAKDQTGLRLFIGTPEDSRR